MKMRFRKNLSMYANTCMKELRQCVNGWRVFVMV